MKLRDHAWQISGVKPVPQGSMRAFTVKGRTVLTHAKGGELSLYRSMIVQAVSKDVPRPTRTAITLRLTFAFPRPKVHVGKRGLRPSAPNFFTTKPDVDKLARSVMDSLTGTLYVDDSQVWRLQAMKQYADTETFTLIEATWWEDA
jgi:crossover junction endodeoxyribonuclease RusA